MTAALDVLLILALVWLALVGLVAVAAGVLWVIEVVCGSPVDRAMNDMREDL